MVTINMIKCEKCGNEDEFVVVVASVFNIYVDGKGKTKSRETMSDSCTGVDRVECSMCRNELDNVGYDVKTGKAFLYSEEYAHIKAVTS